MDNFPVEIVFHMLSYMDLRDVYHLAKTCKYYRYTCNDNILWKSIFNIYTQPLCEYASIDEYNKINKTHFSGWLDAYMYIKNSPQNVSQLDFAITSQHIELFIFISKHISIDTTYWIHSALAQWSILGNKRLVSILLDNYSVDPIYTGRHTYSSLTYAIAYNHMNIVDIFLNHVVSSDSILNNVIDGLYLLYRKHSIQVYTVVAKYLLTHPKVNTSKITKIALSYGFNDINKYIEFYYHVGVDSTCI